MLKPNTKVTKPNIRVPKKSFVKNKTNAYESNKPQTLQKKTSARIKKPGGTKETPENQYKHERIKRNTRVDQNKHRRGSKEKQDNT